MHTALMNILPALRPDDRPRALYHGLTAVARDCAGQAPRFPIAPLPGGGENDLAALKRWFRQFIEVRNSDGAERCIASAVRSGASGPEVADMLFAAASDHRYVSIGHPLDFTNKAFEALDTAGWEHAELVLTSLVDGLAGAARMEESDSWRRPVDLVALLERAFVALPDALAEGAAKVHDADFNRAELAAALLDDDPAACIEALLSALRLGATPEQAASATAYAAALRIAQFSTSNEFGDWDTVLHTFTFANAVHQGMKRAPSIELLRGVFDTAMSVYLDRFLNTPPAALPRERKVADPEALLVDLEALFDRRQQVDQSAELTAAYLASGGDPAKLLAALGSSLLREDRDFHTIQAIEAAFRQFENLGAASECARVLVAATRYLAAHAATPR
ncbi:MAG: Rieske (2Fe-2S) protein, partial [Chloroflexia bacterium]